jgi:hypothetical protein
VLTRTEREKVIQMILGMAELYDHQVSTIALTLYLNALQDLPFGQIEKAFEGMVKTHKFYPKPSEIREWILGSPIDRAELAYFELHKAESNFGAYFSVKFKDAVLSKVVESFGGWVKVCQRPSADAEQEKFWKLDFIKTYMAFSSSDREFEAVVHPGIFESENGRKGMLEDERVKDQMLPQLIGEEEKNVLPVLKEF